MSTRVSIVHLTGSSGWSFVTSVVNHETIETEPSDKMGRNPFRSVYSCVEVPLKNVVSFPLPYRVGTIQSSWL